ncbi:MAG: hypothetical protein AAFX78_02745 [Cyanobacteria bacterium J06638_20]
MAVEWFREHTLYGTSRVMLDKAMAVAVEYEDQGLKLTLRQLYYQMVARGFIENKLREYKKLGRVITNAREAGMMSWDIIEDLGRKSTHPYVRQTQTGAMHGLEYALQLDRWQPLDHYVEVWVEKQALQSIVARACKPLYTPYMACKGYLSASEAYLAGKRFEAAIARGKEPVLIHLGDHDPSGINMTSDNRDRLRLFARDHSIQVKRIALNMDQVEEYNPPPNPAKETDSRFQAYQDQFGDSSWELDALPPDVLDTIIGDSIEPFIDRDVWEELDDREDELREPLIAVRENWEEVKDLMEEAGLI